VLFRSDNQTRHTYGFLAFDSPKKNAFKGMPSTLDNRTTPDEFRNYIWSATVFHLGAAMADILGILGGMMVAYFYLDISFIAFYNRMADTLMLRDIILGIVKSLVFAGLIVQTSTYFGLHVKGGAVGVGKYTTKAVVSSIFYVILADSAMSLLFY